VRGVGRDPSGLWPGLAEDVRRTATLSERISQVAGPMTARQLQMCTTTLSARVGLRIGDSSGFLESWWLLSVTSRIIDSSRRVADTYAQICRGSASPS
jgi:hypothetical protein